MKMRYRTWAIVAMLAAVIISGCGITALQVKKDIGVEKVVERSPGKKPKWLEEPFFEKNDHLFYKGEANKVYDRALGFRQAKANAVQNLVESIKIRARSEFSEAVKGINVSEGSLGRYMDNVVAWTSENVDITGAVKYAEYYEKVEVKTYEGVEYYYNCFVQLKIPVENYRKARAKALTKAVEQASDPEAKALAEQVKEKLLQE